MKEIVFWAMAMAAVVTAWRVFRADSMVRAAYWLMASFVAVGVIVVLLGAEFLGLVLLLMMAGEMTIMAVFMVMFMMNPAGLNPMTMVHQHRAAFAAGAVAFVGLAGVGIAGRFPDARVSEPARATAQLGGELLGESMLVFETAGVALLATMIGALAIASSKGRYGVADRGSAPPEIRQGDAGGVPATTERGERDADAHGAGQSEVGDEHAGRGGMMPGMEM